MSMTLKKNRTYDYRTNLLARYGAPINRIVLPSASNN